MRAGTGTTDAIDVTERVEGGAAPGGIRRIECVYRPLNGRSFLRNKSLHLPLRGSRTTGDRRGTAALFGQDGNVSSPPCGGLGDGAPKPHSAGLTRFVGRKPSWAT